MMFSMFPNHRGFISFGPRYQSAVQEFRLGCQLQYQDQLGWNGLEASRRLFHWWRMWSRWGDLNPPFFSRFLKSFKYRDFDDSWCSWPGMATKELREWWIHFAPKSSVILTLEETPNRDWEISHCRKFHLLPFRFMAGFWYALFYKCLGLFCQVAAQKNGREIPLDCLPKIWPRIPCPCFVGFLLLKFGWICSRLFYRAVSPRRSLYGSSLHRFFLNVRNGGAAHRALQSVGLSSVDAAQCLGALKRKRVGRL